MPECGPFWIWKRKLRDDVIAQLEVPSEAARVSSTGRKVRVEFARTVALFGADGTALDPLTSVGVARHDGKTEYKVGEVVRPDKWDPDFRTECSHGIHGFLRRAEAANYA